jgi:hypothetical protein
LSYNSVMPFSTQIYHLLICTSHDSGLFQINAIFIGIAFCSIRYSTVWHQKATQKNQVQEQWFSNWVSQHICVLPKKLKFVNHIKTVNAAITFKVFTYQK